MNSNRRLLFKKAAKTGRLITGVFILGALPLIWKPLVALWVIASSWAYWRHSLRYVRKGSFLCIRCERMKPAHSRAAESNDEASPYCSECARRSQHTEQALAALSTSAHNLAVLASLGREPISRDPHDPRRIPLTSLAPPVTV